MPGLADFIKDSNPLIIIIYVILLIGTGGVGTAWVTGRMASKRGIKGDALVKEQNGIEGLTNLGTLQGTFITTLQKQITDQQQQLNDLADKLDLINGKLESEIEYSNLLIQTLSENTVPIPPRKKK